MIGLSPLIAGLTTHGLAVLLVLAVLVLVLTILGREMIRWILSSEERSDRVVRMMSAWRGKSRPPITEWPRSLSGEARAGTSPASGRSSGRMPSK